MSSAGEKCHRCRRNPGTLRPRSTGELLCLNCHSIFIAQLVENGRPLTPSPIASPPTSVSTSNSTDQFGPPNSRKRKLSITNLPAAARSTVKDLPDVVDAKSSGSVCVVCESWFDIGMKVAALPCEHLFHRECILPWVDSHNTCPVCDSELPTDDPVYESQMNSVSSENPGSSGSGNPGDSGSENPLEPGVSSSENQVVSSSESQGVSGSDDPPGVSGSEKQADSGDVNSSGPGSGSGH